MNTITATRFQTQGRTFLLLAGLTALFVSLGGLLGGSSFALLFAAIAVVSNVVMYWKSDKLALRMSRAQPLAETDDPELYAMVRRLAGRAGVPMPRLYVIPQEQPNAFATGRNPENAAIAVTAGIRRHMPAYQLEGVLAHEFAHIKNRDILVQTVAATIGGVIAALANALQFSFLFGGSDDEDSGPLGMIGALAAIILAPIAAMLIQMAVSRQREYLADATGAQLLGTPRPLADALESLEQGTRLLPMRVSPAAEPLYIVSPLSGQGLSGLFATHPPLQERVARLRALTV
jgi:heat shock protein HtpX